MSGNLNTYLSNPIYKKQFWEEGYLHVPAVFGQEEMDYVRKACLSYSAFHERVGEIKRLLEQKQKPRFSTIINHNSTDGFDILSKIARRKFVMDLWDHLFDDTCYAFHNKIITKVAGMCGFRYHQDYAYWYNTGCLFPDTASIFCSVDPADRSNGCLKLIPRSHKLGRQDHVVFPSHPDDRGMEPKRLEIVRQKFGERYIEMQPGDICFFHGNILHGSDDNESSNDRLAVVATYNFRNNNPYFELDEHNCGHPEYSYQVRVSEKICLDDILNMPNF